MTDKIVKYTVRTNNQCHEAWPDTKRVRAGASIMPEVERRSKNEWTAQKSEYHACTLCPTCQCHMAREPFFAALHNTIFAKVMANMYFFANNTEAIFKDPAKSATCINGRVLVLNQSYEPVSICSVQKAVILLFLNKAELVDEIGHRCIRSISAKWPFPSIIRLFKYHRIPYKSIMLSRKNILRRDGYRCQYCGTASAQLTVDHITPRSRGGSDSWENLITACVACNNKKGNRPLEKTDMSLLSKPRRPSHVSFILQSVQTVDDPWKPYLFQA